MKGIRSITAAGVAAAAATLAASAVTPAGASSHREAPAIAEDPSADNTDVWAWVTPGSRDTLHVVASWIPFEEPASGPNFYKFSDEVRYEIHLAMGADDLEDDVVYRFEFDTSKLAQVDPADLEAPLGGGKEFFAQLSGQMQTYTVTRIERGREKVIARDVPVAPPRIGPRTYSIAQKAEGGSESYDDAFAATFIKSLGGDEGEQGRVWAGQRDDGFYADVGGIFDLANLRPEGQAPDSLSGFNVHAIAIDIPLDTLFDGEIPTEVGNDSLVGVWASSSRQQVRNLGKEDKETKNSGGWRQVSRLGLPLVNEAVIGLQDKDKYNRTQPKDDVKNFGAYFLNPVIVRDAEAVGIYEALGVDPTRFKSERLDIIQTINLANIPTEGAHSIPLEATGDVLRVDVAVDSSFPNGRSLVGGAEANMEQADVTDVLLSLLLTGLAAPISDGVSANDKAYLTEMPYLALPWEGFSEGHGRVPRSGGGGGGDGDGGGGEGGTTGSVLEGTRIRGQ